MTREEAIAILQDEAYFLYEDDVPYNRQAFEMAISALTLKSPCSLCRYRNEDTGLCDMCPAMPLERGAE